MLTQLATHTAPAYLIGAYVLFGLGMGQLNPPITNTAVSGMPPSQAGVAASVASTSRQVGVTLGVAVLGAIAGAGVTGRIGSGFAAATHPAWWTVVGLGVLILAMAILTTTGWAQDTAARTAERFREGRGPGPARAGPTPPAGVLERRLRRPRALTARAAWTAGPGAGCTGSTSGPRGCLVEVEVRAQVPDQPVGLAHVGRGSGRPSVAGLSRWPPRKSSSMNLL